MRYDVITIFPEIFKGFLEESILGKAQKKKTISINIHQLRDWSEGKHKQVDDIPYGGGPGMVLKIEPIYKAVNAVKNKVRKKKARKRVILLSPRGKKFDKKASMRLAKYDQLIFICGRYEGIDERVEKYVADESFSVGDYILIGGEVAAMAMIESVSRFIPGVIGKKESVNKDDYPQYTRPEIFKSKDGKSWKVPKILTSGDHKKIKEWREKRSKK